MSTWKNVGMTYLKYADLCATHVRNALKEPMKTKSAAMSDMHIRIMQWEGGKRGKPGAHQLLPTCWQAVFLPVLLAPSLVACAVLERAHWARPAILQAAPVCGPDTRQLSPSPPFGGARKRSAPAALTLCARPFAFAFAARRDRDQDGCSVILVATARSYFCGAHRCSCGGALRSARHILLSGAAAGVLDAPGTRFEMGCRCVLSRFPTHASCRSRRPSRGGKKHISEKSACGVTWPRGAPPARRGGAASLHNARGRRTGRSRREPTLLFFAIIMERTGLLATSALSSQRQSLLGCACFYGLVAGETTTLLGEATPAVPSPSSNFRQRHNHTRGSQQRVRSRGRISRKACWVSTTRRLVYTARSMSRAVCCNWRPWMALWRRSQSRRAIMQSWHPGSITR